MALNVSNTRNEETEVRDFYSQEMREALLDEDALHNEEDGFMLGYEEDLYIEDEELDADEDVDLKG